MTDLDDAEWAAAAHPCAAFALDVGFGTPPFVPSHLQHPAGITHSSPIDPVTLPTVGGMVLSADAVGREAELAAFYHRLAAAASPMAGRPDSAAHRCLEVNIVVQVPHQPPVVLDLFGGAQRAADQLLAEMANPTAPPGVAYDNLDQGWAVRVLTTARHVVVLAWDWDRALEGQTVQAMRLDRANWARQAASARQRLARLHPALCAAVGTDLWNLPTPPAPAGRSWWRR